MRRRRSLRLAGYDYSSAGAYFVTSCTHQRECLFGRVLDGHMLLNESGRIVADVWGSLSARFPSVELDAFVVMPNHVHGIVVLTDEGSTVQASGAASGAPTSGPVQGSGAASGAPTLGAVVRAFKSISAVQINRLLSRAGRAVWQPNYYEHIVRDERSLVRIREYIETNPNRWQLDRENLERGGDDAFDLWLDGFKRPA